MRASSVTASDAHQTTLRACFRRKKKCMLQVPDTMGTIFSSITFFLVWGGLPVLIFIEFLVFWASKMPKFSRPTLVRGAEHGQPAFVGRGHPLISASKVRFPSDQSLQKSSRRGCWFVSHCFFRKKKIKIDDVTRAFFPSDFLAGKVRPGPEN